MVKNVDIAIQALSAFLVLAVAMVLLTIQKQLSDSTLPVLLASAASFSAMISLSLKTRTSRASKWGLYLYVFVMILMLANSVAYFSIHDSRFLPLALSGPAFILAVVTTVKEQREERIAVTEDSGCIIQLVIAVSFAVQVALVLIFFIFHGMWE